MNIMKIVRSKLTVMALLLLSLAVLVSGCFGGNNSNILVVVNEEEVTRSQMDDVLKMVRLYTPGIDEMLEEEGFNEMFEETFLRMLVDNALVKQELASLELEVSESELEEAYAEFRNHLILEGYGSDEELDQRIEELDFSKESILDLLYGEAAGNVLFDYIVADVSDADVREFAEEYQLLAQPAYIRAHHILLETEEDALAVFERVNEGGEDFGDVAQEVSVDPTAALNRGYLDRQTENDLVADFWKGAFALDAGEISQPVESTFGWHIIKLDEKGESIELEFEDVKEELRERKEEQLINNYFEQMWSEADIDFLLEQ